MRHLILLGLALASLASHADKILNTTAVDVLTENIATAINGTLNGYEPVALPVFTATSPREVLEYRDATYPPEAPWAPSAKLPITVLNVVLPSGKNYPDVVCFVFINLNRICFDPMEITER